jgi:hypothetical protein
MLKRFISVVNATLLINALVVQAQVRITDINYHSAGNLPCYKVETESATYYLEKTGLGLASMIDRDGNDWISFNPGPGTGAAGEYRGFPNAVHQQDGSFFHPKNKGTQPSTSKVVFESPDRVAIEGESENGNWACRWDFYPDHCRFTMTRMPEKFKYWVLYEGTPGGNYDDTDWYFSSASIQKQPLTRNYEADLPAPEWIAFGDPEQERILFLLHHQDDPHPDKFYQMEKQMTVFGFGRENLVKYLDNVPQSFSIGFTETTNPENISKKMELLLLR